MKENIRLNIRAILLKNILNFLVDFHTVPNATGKYVDVETFDYRIFKLNNEFGKSYDIINRKVLEPSFEAIVDAGKRLICRYL